jgi:uncharacterized protein (DUF1810 family)
MTDQNSLKRFIEAQKSDYELALQQVRQGKKTGHWMWYIFPQIRGLGHSETSVYFAIRDMDEAREYFTHPVLGARLVEISNEILKLNIDDPVAIFGSVDSLKLKSSMTLFSLVEKASPVFQLILDKYFNGKRDINTIRIANI